MASTIKLKNGSGAPLASDLVQGEPALDLTNKRLYTEDSLGAVIEVGTNPTSLTSGDITVTGTITASGEISANGGIALGDSDVATFGDGDDLQIYHDGTNSYIDDSGTGDLYVRASDDLRLQVRNDTDTAWASSVICNDGGETSLHYNGTKKIATTNTGIDVTGTVTADGLTVESASTLIATFEAPTVAIELQETDTTDQNTRLIHGTSAFYVQTVDDASSATTSRFKVDHSTGDISFYEDTGTTAKFFWDASAESLGIGTTSPASLLHISSAEPEIRLSDTTNVNSEGHIRYNAGVLTLKADPNQSIGGSSMRFDVDGSEAMRIDSSGNVGIGTTSPAEALDVIGDVILSTTGSLDVGVLHFGDTPDETKIVGRGPLHASAPDTIDFVTNTATAMRIDSSGNVGIGTDSPKRELQLGDNTGNEIISLQSSTSGDGSIYFGDNQATSAEYAGMIRYSHSDNSMQFRTSSTERMRIDSSGNLLVNCTSAKTQGTAVSGGNPILQVEGDIVPSIWAGLTGHSDLGDSTYNYEDAYVRDGVTTTSDRNEKQDIEELSEAEQRVAVAVKSLLRKYRWISSVAEKGDDARIHFGIIAQDLQAAFEAEGLDAGRYAMFMSNTWWEAEETYTDNDGIEQTRIKTYDTAEEAPEGAVERTRLGVRYNQLLAFIMAAI